MAVAPSGPTLLGVDVIMVATVLSAVATFAVLIALYAATTVRDPMARRVKALNERREQLKAGIVASTNKRKRITNRNAAADRVRGLVQKTGVAVSALGYYPNPLSAVPKERRVAADHLKKVMTAAARLGLGVVNTFVGRNPARTAEDQWPFLKEVWEELLRHAGIEEPSRVLEPLLSAALANTLQQGDAALTGPVARGDAGTVAGHVALLRDVAPDIRPTYLYQFERMVAAHLEFRKRTIEAYRAAGPKPAAAKRKGGKRPIGARSAWIRASCSSSAIRSNRSMRFVAPISKRTIESCRSASWASSLRASRTSCKPISGATGGFSIR